MLYFLLGEEKEGSLLKYGMVSLHVLLFIK